MPEDPKLKSLLRRSTEDPPADLARRVRRHVETSQSESRFRRSISSGQLRNPTTSAGRNLQRLVVLGSMVAVIAFVALAVSGVLSKGVPSTKPVGVAIGPIDTARSTTLDLRLDTLTISPSGTPAKSVAPAVGPDLAVVVRGRGRIEAPTDGAGGRQFLVGGQQSADTAFLTATGANVRSLFSPIGGRLTIDMMPLADLQKRTTSTGRNIVAFVQVVADDSPKTDADRAIANLLSVTLSIAPEIGPYLSVNLNGASHSYPIPPELQPAFSAGRSLKLGVRWARGDAQLLVNDTTVDTFAYPTVQRELTARARLSIGASADFGAGFFSAHEDSLQKIVISSATGT